ncbi:glycosyltransferase family A protein [Alphaproteobacteria bacterium]|nr:glycosyltransferase family A protein [Alphaproteobacteria bacterium]
MTPITAQNVAIICPTKNQPEKVLRLLKSVSRLDEKPHQVIIADGGHNLKPVTTAFTAELNLICLYCPEAGQILQRNHAHKHLDKNIQLVLHLDDDVTLDHDSLGKMIIFWNEESQKSAPPLAGASFNIKDMPQLRSSAVRNLFFLQTKPAGHVSIAGYAAPFTPTETNMQTSWLLGGATAWSRNIIDTRPHPINFSTRWAVCEDLIYSYPLAREYRLMVAADANAYHNETYSEMSFRQGMFYGVSGAIMRYHFVRQNPDLKTWAYMWMTIGVILGNFGKGLSGSPRHLGLCLGGTVGLMRTIAYSLINGDSARLAKALNKG